MSWRRSPVEPPDGRAVGGLHHLILQRFDRVPYLLDDDEVGVHDHVDERIGQIVRPQLPDGSLVLADPLANGIENVAGLGLLECDDPPVAPHDAHLLAREAVVPRVRDQHPEHHVEILPEVLSLGALAGVDHILEQQRMESERRAQLFHHLHLMHAVQVDPGHRRVRTQRHDLFQRGDLALPVERLPVLQHGDLDRRRGFFAHVDQGPREQSGLLRTSWHAPGWFGVGHARSLGRTPRHRNGRTRQFTCTGCTSSLNLRLSARRYLSSVPCTPKTAYVMNRKTGFATRRSIANRGQAPRIRRYTRPLADRMYSSPAPSSPNDSTDPRSPTLHSRSSSGCPATSRKLRSQPPHRSE